MLTVQEAHGLCTVVKDRECVIFSHRKQIFLNQEKISSSNGMIDTDLWKTPERIMLRLKTRWKCLQIFFRKATCCDTNHPYLSMQPSYHAHHPSFSGSYNWDLCSHKGASPAPRGCTGFESFLLTSAAKISVVLSSGCSLGIGACVVGTPAPLRLGSHICLRWCHTMYCGYCPPHSH